MKHTSTKKTPIIKHTNSKQNKPQDKHKRNNPNTKIKQEIIKTRQKQINNNIPRPLKKPKINNKIIPIFFDLCDNHLAIYYTSKIIALDINIIFNQETLPAKLIHCIHLILLNLPDNKKYSEITIYNKTKELEKYFIENFSNENKNKNKNNKINSSINKIKSILKRKGNTIRVKTENNHKLIDKVTNLAKKFDNNCWKFNPSFLKNTINELNLPEPTVDCFASSSNKQCNIYFS